MSDLSDAARDALRYWPEIEEAARNRYTTAELWDSIRAAADEEGLPTPGASLLGVNELRAMATRIQESGRQLERVDPEVVLSHEHYAEAPWSRAPQQRETLGMWQVRYQHTTVTDEGPQTQWRTSVFRGSFPQTRGELEDSVAEDAQALADKYGVSHVEFGSLQILTV